MPVQFTTSLPDDDQPVLGNGVEDEIAMDRESAPTNYGDVRIQTRETGATAWGSTATGWDEQVVSYDTLTTTVTGREDGEEYEVRARTETEHVTGTWTDPVSIVAKFPGATNAAVSIVTTTDATITWDDVSDNEDGFDVERAKRYDSDWGPWRTVAQLDPNTSQYDEVDTLDPNREYRWRIRAYTEHTEAYSDPASATTSSTSVRQTNVPTRGWHVEVEHPSGRTLTPSVIADGTEWLPTLNGLPRVEIAVPKADVWEGTDLDGVPLRVWKDGQELPIDEIRSTGREADHDVIEGIGGTELEQDIAGVEYPEKNAHLAAEEQITTHTSYAADVDDPSTNTREDVRMQSAGSSDSSWFDTVQDGTFAATSPLYVSTFSVYSEPTAAFLEGEGGSGDGATYFADTEGNDGAWSDNEAQRLTSGDTRSWDWDVDYTIPQGDAVVEIVWATPTDPTPGMTIEFNNTVVDQFSSGSLGTDTDKFDMGGFQLTLNSGGDLGSGIHTLDITIDSGEEVYIDFIHFRDDRFSYTTNDYQASNQVVTGWEQYPPSLDVVFDPVSSVEQVVAGQVDVEISGTENNQALGLRNDTNNAFTEASNTTTHSVDFGSASQLIQTRVTLSRYDSGTSSGEFGDEFQRLDSMDLYADLTNMPVLLDFVFEGQLVDGLNRIADAGDFVWEVRRIDGQDTIVWTQPGQRVADREPDLADYSGRRTLEGSFQRIIAQGKSRRVEGETFSVSSYGSLTGLNEGPPLVPGKERVYDTGTDPTEYERSIDYNIDHREGAIELLSGGSMQTGTDYLIDYEWRYEGSYTDPEATDPRTRRTNFPGASSDRECEQLAIAVVREVSDPLEEVTATIDAVDPGQPLTEALVPEDLPFEGPLRVRELSSQPGTTELTLGSRRGIGDVIAELNERVDALAQNI